MDKDYITNSELCDILVDDSILKAVKVLGEVKTLEDIESMKPAIYRAKLRQGYYRYMDNKGGV